MMGRLSPSRGFCEGESSGSFAAGGGAEYPLRGWG